jgi:hypothetical protein
VSDFAACFFPFTFLIFFSFVNIIVSRFPFVFGAVFALPRDHRKQHANSVAVVTGCTDGIGKEYALQVRTNLKVRGGDAK